MFSGSYDGRRQMTTELIAELLAERKGTAKNYLKKLEPHAADTKNDKN